MGGSGEKTHECIDLGGLTWYYKDSGTSVAPYFYAEISGIKYKGGFWNTNYGFLSSDYKSSARNTSAFVNGCVCADGVDATQTVLQIQIKDDRYTDAATFKTAMNGVQLCYEKATPETLSLTPFPQTLLEGVNNVWAEMSENSTVIDNAQQSLSYQPQNIVGELRQEIEAKPDSFAQLSDTSFSNLSNGQIPKWNSTSGKWENANESGGGGTFTRISVQNIVGSTWISTPNNIASLTITASKEDLGLNNDDFYILEGVELVDWQDSSKKYPYVITKFIDDRENDSITIYGFMIHNESSIRGVNHTFNFIVVS